MGNNNEFQIPHRRHKFKTFKNPPQPVFCIKSSVIQNTGCESVFINVFSWTRIANPVNITDPVPLYGGMRVHSTKYQDIMIFAVMASPDVLKNSGRKTDADSAERTLLIDLMCEFVEAMNPGLILEKTPEILKDRDLIGELKDSWYSVQAVREKEKAENYPDSVEVFGPDTAPVVKTNREKNTLDEIPQPSEHNTDKDIKIINNTSFDEQLIEKLTINETNPDHHLTREAEEYDLSKSKESQNIFFTKFRNSSKEKECSDDTRLKPKKSLNFFRKHKCASQSTKNDKNKNESVSAK
ncbi:unnamed protein product [Diamesa serratosioi]